MSNKIEFVNFFRLITTKAITKTNKRVYMKNSTRSSCSKAQVI